METVHASAIWLIFPIAGVAFMLWVLCSFVREEMRNYRRRPSSTPVTEEMAPHLRVPNQSSASGSRRYVLYPTRKAVRD